MSQPAPALGYLTKIRALNPCVEALELLIREQHPTAEAAWLASRRGDWMLWLLGHGISPDLADPRRVPLTLAACEGAALTLPLLPPRRGQAAGGDRDGAGLVSRGGLDPGDRQGSQGRQDGERSEARGQSGSRCSRDPLCALGLGSSLVGGMGRELHHPAELRRHRQAALPRAAGPRLREYRPTGLVI